MLETLQARLTEALKSENFQAFAALVRSGCDELALAEGLVAAAHELQYYRPSFEAPFLDVIESENHWARACDAFDEVRVATLHYERTKPNPGAEALLLFQENLLKHLCLLRGNRRGFDTDSGTWAVVCLLHILSELRDETAISVSTAFLNPIANERRGH